MRNAKLSRELLKVKFVDNGEAVVRGSEILE